jgi:uncharacterized repeat protein (TIGR02543 family)
MKKWKTTLLLILIVPFMLLQGFSCTSTPGLKIYHTVSFYSGSVESLYDEIEVESGHKIYAPQPPTRTGYIFVGWYKDNTCTVKWNFNTDKVEGDVKLFAKWDEAQNNPENPDEPETPPSETPGGEST